MSKEKEKKEEIVKPLSIEIKEAKEEIIKVFDRHKLPAISISEIGIWLNQEAMQIMQSEEQRYYEKLKSKMKGEEEDGVHKEDVA